MEALRQILVQNFLADARGVLRPRTEKDGQPKGARRIVSPYDWQTRRAIRGNTRWSGYLVHVTETCDTDENANLITDIATTSPIRDTQALPGIHTRLRQRWLLPREHLVDGGYLSVALLESSAVRHQIQLIGPVKASGAWQKKQQTGFTRDDFTIDFDRRDVTCPNGQTTKTWITPPAMAPYTVARFPPPVQPVPRPLRLHTGDLGPHRELPLPSPARTSDPQPHRAGVSRKRCSLLGWRRGFSLVWLAHTRSAERRP
ncbi:hypothetical protein AB0E16_05440, partial [Streptomyces sp. NPDC047970]